MTMNEAESRRSGLSETKRALLERRLRGAAAASPGAAAASEARTIIPSAGPGPVYPASFAQERFWFHTMLDPGSGMYNVPVASIMNAAPEIPVLQRAVTEVRRRHEALRTVFRVEDGMLKQVVQEPETAPIDVIDLRDRIQSMDDVRQAVTDEGGRPLDIINGPVMRVSVLRVADDRWVQVVTVHHIATDGWAFPVVLREISQLYDAFAAGRPSPLPEPRLRYVDYTVWHRNYLQGEVLQKQVDYWRRTLDGAPVVEMPADRPRPPQPSFRGGAVRFFIPGDLTTEVRRLCQQESATLNMVLMAAMAVLLRAYTGSEDLVVGSLFGNRNMLDLEEVVGLTVNTGVVRTRLDGDPRFEEVVRQTRRSFLEADQHQDLPWEKLVDELGVPRDPSRHPVFQIMYFHHTLVRMHKVEARGTATAALAQRPVYDNGMGIVDNGMSKFDLSIATLETFDGIGGFIEYALDLFDEPTIQLFARHFLTVVTAAVSNPSLRVSEIPLLDEEETQMVLGAWSPGEVAEGAPGPVHRLIQARAAEQPDAPAVADDADAFTYGELERRANRIAHRLIALGVGPETRVAVLSDRSARQVAGILGVAKAGGAYVPVDPAYPAERVAWMLADCGAPVVLAARAAADRLPEGGPTVLWLDDDFADESGEAPAVEVDAGHLAYLIYTSGSTGTPKGVEVPHGGLANLTAWYAGAAALTPADRMTLVAGVGFDASVMETWPALAAGASLHVPADELRADAPRLRDWMVRERITVAFLPTPMAEAVLPLEWPADGALRLLAAGGEALRARPRADCPFALVDLYGPAENTIVSTGTAVAPDMARPTIGRPITNTRAYVLDERLRLSPPTVPGELYVAGANLSRGYHGRPALTAERFVPDPFSPVPGARMYRTGDRARWRVDGLLEFLGRADGQVKLRGIRIETGEIETALRAHDGVSDAAVLLREDRPGDRRLVAYWVPADGVEAPAAADLRTWLRARLPEQMVPAAFARLDVLPMTPNGKLDRRALPAPDASADERVEYVAPRTVVEDALAAMWAELLHRDRVGVLDNFFDMGGHSILVTQVLARVGDTFEVEIPIRTFFADPTIAGLAKAIDAAGSSVLDEMMAEMAGLTPEEIEALLQASA
jgi:amino acid adenylation domain-containing protein